MTFILKQFFSLLAMLNSETGENQIAAGIALGLILGFSPALSLQSIVVFLILFFFRVQFGAALLSGACFKFIAWILDPVSNAIGMQVLEADSLRPLFTELYNMPIVPLTRFYNSIVMGSGILAALLAVPLFFLTKSLIKKYRVTIVARYQNTKFWKFIKATKFYGLYTKYNEYAS